MKVYFQDHKILWEEYCVETVWTSHSYRLSHTPLFPGSKINQHHQCFKVSSPSSHQDLTAIKRLICALVCPCDALQILPTDLPFQSHSCRPSSTAKRSRSVATDGEFCRNPRVTHFCLKRVKVIKFNLFYRFHGNSRSPVKHALYSSLHSSPYLHTFRLILL